jgi:hypothetical protein
LAAEGLPFSKQSGMTRPLMNKETQNKANFISSIAIIAFSAGVMYFSLVMPRYEKWGLYATPGLTPFAFGALLLGCGLILFFRSIAKGGYRIKITRSHLRFLRSKAVQHFIVVLGLVVMYYFFFGKLHFVLISAAYVFFNILYFRTTAWWKNLIISVCIAGSVWYLFTFLFIIPLP